LPSLLLPWPTCYRWEGFGQLVLKGAGWRPEGWYFGSNKGDVTLVIFLRQIAIILDIGLLMGGPRIKIKRGQECAN
jgi:hypothetical protein